jgi:hypothetical protein
MNEFEMVCQEIETLIGVSVPKSDARNHLQFMQKVKNQRPDLADRYFRSKPEEPIDPGAPPASLARQLKLSHWRDRIAKFKDLFSKRKTQNGSSVPDKRKFWLMTGGISFAALLAFTLLSATPSKKSVGPNLVGGMIGQDMRPGKNKDGANSPEVAKDSTNNAAASSTTNEALQAAMALKKPIGTQPPTPEIKPQNTSSALGVPAVGGSIDGNTTEPRYGVTPAPPYQGSPSDGSKSAFQNSSNMASTTSTPNANQSALGMPQNSSSTRQGMSRSSQRLTPGTKILLTSSASIQPGLASTGAYPPGATPNQIGNSPQSANTNSPSTLVKPSTSSAGVPLTVSSSNPTAQNARLTATASPQASLTSTPKIQTALALSANKPSNSSLTTSNKPATQTLTTSPSNNRSSTVNQSTPATTSNSVQSVTPSNQNVFSRAQGATASSTTRSTTSNNTGSTVTTSSVIAVPKASSLTTTNSNQPSSYVRPETTPSNTTSTQPGRGSSQPVFARMGSVSSATRPSSAPTSQSAPQSEPSSSQAALPPAIPVPAAGVSAAPARPQVSSALGLPGLEFLIPNATVGQRFPAKLLTTVIAVEQGLSPMIAETKGNYCGTENCPTILWVGQAFLGPDKRVHAKINSALVGDKEVVIKGQALGVDLGPGLVADIRDEAPTLVMDLLRGGISAFGDYLGAAVTQKTTTVIQGGAVQATSLPSLGDFFLGKIGSLFSLGNSGPTFIRVARVEKETSFTVLYGIDPSTAPSNR